MKENNNKFIVTGGAGFIGSHLVDALIEQGHKVAVIDNLYTGKKENLNPQAEFHQLDIRDFGKIRPLFEGVDGVFHLAAIPRVPLSVNNPVETSEVNIQGTVNVFKAAQEAGTKRIVFASSSSVYGDQKVFPLKEDMKPNPMSPYGLQKYAGELFAKMFSSDLYRLPVVSLRFFNVYGPRIDFESEYSLVLGKFLKLKSEGKPLTIYGDGEQSRAFCYVSDVVDACIRAFNPPAGGKGGEVINVGNTKSHTVNHLADLVGGEKVYLDARPGDPRKTEADITLARELLGWEPKIDLEQGVEEVKRSTTTLLRS